MQTIRPHSHQLCLPGAAARVLVNHRAWHILRAYYVPGAVLQPFTRIISLIFLIIHNDYPNFTNAEMRLRGVRLSAQDVVELGLRRSTT